MKKKSVYVLMSAFVASTSIGLMACGGESDNETQTTVISTNQTDRSNETTRHEQTTKKEETTKAEEDNKLLYKVTVVDEAGNPIAGAMVQMCKESCVPAVTNAEGVADFRLEAANYDVKFIELPAGYTYSGDEQVFKFSDGELKLTITLKKAS